ncbi:MAG: hypothetical protein H0U95_12955 [Bacteroidetes bacterium]|nr:hypothetical protein [Bacteroidota bacterium]
MKGNNFVNLWIDFRKMRFIVIIFLICIVGFACVKRPTKSPVPTIEFIDFTSSKPNGIDAGSMILGYEDGDGDIFREKTTPPSPNLIMKFYYYNNGTHKFTGFFDTNISDTFNIAKMILQPGDGFKGKSIQGNIYIPMNEFRPADSIKIFKYVVFAVDEAGHNSNILTTPQFTVNY